MVDIFNHLDYNNDCSVDDWNSLTREIFFKYFSSENNYLRNKELLRTELMNYVMLYPNEDYIKMLNAIHEVFESIIFLEKEKSFEILFDNFKKISDTNDRYISYCISQSDINNYTKKDLAIYYFRAIDEIVEGCFEPRFRLFYQFHTNKLFENLGNKSLGNLVNDKEFRNFDLLIKDPIVGIHINQWRNIAAHKDFEISKDNIKVIYGSKRDKVKIMSHEELKQITFWVRDAYGALRLAEVLIYLNYMQEIKSFAEDKNIDFYLRSETYLLHLIHNLQIVGFKYASFVENDTTFELNLFIKNNNDVKESIIHATQVFSRIARALDDDEFQKDKFTDIQINILNKEKEVVANAIVDIRSCLDFSNYKLNQEELINQINFNINEYK
ncbi:MAG: hypothetical protein Q7S59_08580 [Sulfurimonas sp.]|nr:hypothetical protein [Sulfurimonas sp.]